MIFTKTFKVITPWGPETGFRLGGAQVVIATDKESLNEEMGKILKEKETGILAIPAHMEKWISEKNQKTMKQTKTLLLVRYTFPEQWQFASEADRFTEEMVFRAIGYHLRIKL